ncbi:MAG: sulfatase-like hydrolase/transferase [Vitreoscilla sp.]
MHQVDNRPGGRLPAGAGRWVGIALLGCLLLAAHGWPTAAGMAILLAASAGFVAYAGSGRAFDAAVLALPPLAGAWVDAAVGPAAFLAACLVAYLVTRRALFAAVLGSSAAGLLPACIGLKERFAGTPLTWQDLRFFFLRFHDNIDVMASQPTLLAIAAGAVAVAVVLSMLAWRWSPPGRRAGGRGPLVAVVVAVLLIAHSSDIVARKAARLSAAGDAWVVGEGQLRRPILTFFATASLEPRWQVPAVDTAAFRGQSRQLVSSRAPGRLADIVVFLQESQFDPAAIAGCPASICALDAFAAHDGTVARGPLQVHTFGGGTWKSEFAFHTGVPHSAFGPAGEFVPFNVAPGTQRSFARSLKAAGYRTVALYPTRGGMMNGRAAYAGYGFDAFYDAAQVGLPGGYDTPDALVHAAARDVLARERLHDQPVFLFVLTIFNHAEHGVRMERVPLQLVSAASKAFEPADEALSVADYVWRSQAFERASAATRSAVLGTRRPAVYAWFGDHQPPFANAIGLRQRIRSLPTETGTVPARYQTWYEVASNVPHAADSSPRALDLVFLPGTLAQAAGVPLDDWLAANVLAREQCGGLLEACRAPGVREAYLSHLWRDLRAFELP